jgi:formate hydrogenlyase subunit 3/multisubunit Na+/H+ antiporter MnhD subunit
MLFDQISFQSTGTKTVTFLLIGFLIKIVGIFAAVCFVKIYSKNFINLFFIFAAISETAQCFCIVKLFSTILLLSGFSEFISTTSPAFFTTVLTTVSMLRARKIKTTIAYSTFQNVVPTVLLAVVNYNQVNITLSNILTLIVYSFSTTILLETISLKPSIIKKIFLLVISFSISGAPFTAGFFTKALLFGSVVESALLIFFILFIYVSISSFGAYGRLLTYQLQTSLIYNKLNLGYRRLYKVILIPIIFGYFFIKYGVILCGNLCRFILSPIFESTDHKFGLILSAISLLNIESPNKHLFYSFGETF